MIELKTRAEQFLKSIQAEGERQCAAIRSKTEAEVSSALAAARREEQARADRTIAFEAARAKTQANRTLSAARSQARAALAQRRQALSNELEAFRARLQELMDERNFGQRRLLRAFPRMRSTTHRQALERLRRRMEIRREQKGK